MSGISKTHKILGIVILTAFLCGFVFLIPDANNSGKSETLLYDLTQPDEMILLPPELTEISGLAYQAPKQIAVVQDEDGKVFVIDVKSHQIVTEQKFTKDGDYEGIAGVGNKLFVVRSDGTVYRIKDFDEEDQKTKKYKTLLTKDHDVEGLCYDRVNNRLLLACKEDSGMHERKPGFKSIFAFDLETREIDPDFEILIDVSQIDQMLSQSSGRGLSSEFKPSGISIHPVTGHLYLVSSISRNLIVLDTQFQLRSAVHLDEQLFDQPEGITFSPKGHLYISNEGKNGDPNLLKFRFTPALENE